MARLRIVLPIAAALLVLSMLSGRALERAREDAGLVPSAARIPLGGLEPLAVDILHLRAEIYLRSRRLPEAVASIRLATELQPRIPEYWVELGSLLAWECAHSDARPETQWRWAREGIRVLERGLEHNPDSPEILWALGVLYFRRVAISPELAPLAARDLGAWPSARAREIFRRQMEIDPNMFALGEFGRSTHLLGTRLRATGDLNGALELHREARGVYEHLAEDPEDVDAGELVRRIDAEIEEIEALQKGR